MKIPISKPYFGLEEQRAIIEPLETGWVVQGPKTAEFERLFSSYTRSPHAIATTSATTALHLALIAIGVKAGDEVIVPAFTWVATANVVEMCSARPVFVDIELDTFNIDVNRIEAAITPRTRAIIPVSLFGVSADMKPIMELARKHGLKVVEDDACATGAWYHGHHAGTLADIGCFSFHPRKAITTGEGGMVITADEGIAEQIRSLRDHGASKSDLARHLGARSYVLPDFNMLGYNYRMTDLQAAVGVVQMGRLVSLLEMRTRIARCYDERLTPLGWLRPPVTPAGCSHGYQSYVCLFQPQKPTMDNIAELHSQRNGLMDAMEAAGVATRPGTHAVHMLGFYREKYGIRPEDFPNACIADQLTVALPLYAQLSVEEQQYVIDNLSSVATPA
ncbi:MAG TPA: DegT/DnrJ/EryC1/StrS family aminotransferase [Thermoanaerobaculia bacterium]|nr:DegT/DnrJ/EryC1/StrS family aminotransferase [Thermoanaerobaculia bacterium]